MGLVAAAGWMQSLVVQIESSQSVMIVMPVLVAEDELLISRLHSDDFQIKLKQMKNTVSPLAAARDEFVTQWGALGSAWGINRTMAQIHALLMTSADPLSTDEVMEQLAASRGNAHTNLKELVNWGLVRIVTRKGERREYFEAEKDVWKMFVTISKERKRRELDPALGVLRSCAEQTKDETSPEGKAFHAQMQELEEFVAFSGKVADVVAGMKHTSALQWAMRLLG
jgi:DNA-binding transcriptional regulator GbsR (MarR family)